MAVTEQRKIVHIDTELAAIAAMVEQRLQGRQGATITLNLKYADYQQWPVAER